jgi:hypothetical protein
MSNALLALIIQAVLALLNRVPPGKFNRVNSDSNRSKSGRPSGLPASGWLCCDEFQG